MEDNMSNGSSERFYKQADTAYKVGQVAFIRDLCRPEDLGNKFIAFVLAAPIVLPIVLISFLFECLFSKNNKGATTIFPDDPETKENTSSASESQEKEYEIDPEFNCIDAIKEIDTILKVMSDRKHMNIKSVLRYLLTLSGKAEDDKIQELKILRMIMSGSQDFGDLDTLTKYVKKMT